MGLKRKFIVRTGPRDVATECQLEPQRKQQVSVQWQETGVRGMLKPEPLLHSISMRESRQGEHFRTG